jgi:hypothetical protein
LKGLTFLFRPDAYDIIERQYGHRPTSIGYPVNVTRSRKVKTEIANGKNIVASIIQEDDTSIGFRLKEEKKEE